MAADGVHRGTDISAAGENVGDYGELRYQPRKRDRSYACKHARTDAIVNEIRREVESQLGDLKMAMEEMTQKIGLTNTSVLRQLDRVGRRIQVLEDKAEEKDHDLVTERAETKTVPTWLLR